jgi:hypothetical protein
MANPIVSDDALFRGFRRVHVDGSAPAGEYIDPYGYVIPKGRGLVVTDLAYYSSFTKPRAPGDLARLFLGYVQVTPTGLSQGLIFVTTPIFAQNGAIGGNVTLHTGFVIPHGRYLSVDLDDFELVATELFVYGYLIDL